LPSRPLRDSFANEILHGAPHIGKFLKGPLKELVEAKALVIRRWVAEGKLRPVDATHFIFAIWAVTQHYADFAVQVEAVTEARRTAPGCAAPCSTSCWAALPPTPRPEVLRASAAPHVNASLHCPP
jgi:TetR/AcrR family transcriptional regulator